MQEKDGGLVSRSVFSILRRDSGGESIYSKSGDHGQVFILAKVSGDNQVCFG